MASESIFGQIVVSSQIEEYVLERLLLWWDDYAREVERQLGRTMGQIPRPHTWTTRNEYTTFPDERMPILVVVNTGTMGDIIREGDGKHTAMWGIAVTVAASGKDEVTSNFLAKFYAAVVRAIMVAPAVGAVWLDESPVQTIDPSEQRKVRAVYGSFVIEVENLVSSGVGPATPTPHPDTDPGSTWPTANTIVINTAVVGPEAEVKSG